MFNFNAFDKNEKSWYLILIAIVIICAIYYCKTSENFLFPFYESPYYYPYRYYRPYIYRHRYPYVYTY